MSETAVPARNATASGGRVELVSGHGDAPKSLVIDFAGFVERLGAIPEVDQAKLEATLAGKDLITALAEEDDEFGRAAPAAGTGASISGQFLAITDEAFSAAHDLLVAGEEAHGSCEDVSRELVLALDMLAEERTAVALHSLARLSPRASKATGTTREEPFL